MSLFAVLLSCSKRGQINGPDPNEPQIISQDTVLSGSLWEFNIGEAADEIYSTIQNVKTDRQIKYLGIINNIFTDVQLLEGRLELYNALFLDETSGTPEGIQIYFEYDKVKSIYKNNGEALGNWPVTFQGNAVVRIGDSIKHIYQPLLAISATPANSPKFQRMSLFQKNVDKGYDPPMEYSPKWQFTSKISDKRFWLVDLNFTAGVLSSMYRTLYEYP